jgi:prepilin-type N-terminal cleavage/methylation domain-containing protein
MNIMKTRRNLGFTLIELLTVIVIIGILVGIVLGVGGNVRKKAAASRAKAEISAIELALERYKIDNADYPDAMAATFPTSSGTYYSGSPNGYTAAGAILFTRLCGREKYTDLATAGTPVYFEAKESQVGDTAGNSYLVDPFGYAYGYVYNAAPANPGDPKSYYNEVVPDIWSTAGQTGTVKSGSDTSASGSDNIYERWVTNWGSR